MRKTMLSLALVVVTLPTVADAPGARMLRDPAATLLERALGTALAAPDTHPTGECIYACGDRQIILKRCPDGDCPEYDCQTGAASCRRR